MSGRLPDRVQVLLDGGYLGRLDVEMARSLSRVAEIDDPLVMLGVAVATRAVGQGHICAELGAIVGETPVDREGTALGGFDWPEVEVWTEALRGSALVGDGTSLTPLVLAGDRLYLTRYFDHERTLARVLNERAHAPVEDYDAERLKQDIAKVFPERTGWQARQALAAVAAVRGRVTVVTGGPGTGKTAVVVRVLALLASQAAAARRRMPRIELLAPTGKAAARLVESITKSIGDLGLAPEIVAAIPRDAATIHRRLGSRFDDPTRFRHDADNPLLADVIVVDEASMVDIGLMRRLLDAVPKDARLILLGDQDQLASVEAGAILGDICLAGEERPGHSRPLLDAAEHAIGTLPPDLPPAHDGDAPLGDRIVELTQSRRFDDESPIGRLASAVRGGDGDTVEAALTRLGDGEGWPDGAEPGVYAVDTPGPTVPATFLEQFLVPAYRRMIEGAGDGDDEQRACAAFAAFGRFRVLCAHRRGPFGVETLNRRIERALVAAGLCPGPGHYPFRPFLVTRNDYQLDLFNGDVGIVLADSTDSSRLRAWFETGDGGLRRVPVARLPDHETCWAMTVHKSQGSEYERVAVVLPNRPSPVLTGELIYTAVTRARTAAVVLGAPGVLVDAVSRRVRRASGLREALWGARER